MPKPLSEMTLQDLFQVFHDLPRGTISAEKMARALSYVKRRDENRDENNKPKYVIDWNIEKQTVERWMNGKVKTTNNPDDLADAVKILWESWANDPEKFESPEYFVKRLADELLDKEIEPPLLDGDMNVNYTRFIDQVVSAPFRQKRTRNDNKKPSVRSLSSADPLPVTLAEDQVPVNGSCITEIPSGFAPRNPHTEDYLSAYYGEIRLGGQRIKVPYKELFGSGKAGVQEYVEGQNLSIHYEDWTADFESRVTRLDFTAELESERAHAASLGYTVHPPKLCLARQMEYKDTKTLSMTFGQSGYLEHRVYRKELAVNEAERDALRQVLSQPRGNNPHLERCPWAASGGGVWLLTSDGYLAVSYRTNVAEERGKLSYSASGSYDRYINVGGLQQDNTPALAMAKEIGEEIGVADVAPEELTLINVGIDAGRALFQLSYVWDCGLTAEDIRYYRENETTTADEQLVFFVPFRRDICQKLLLQCEFEPGAAVSLSRLLEKKFGPEGR